MSGETRDRLLAATRTVIAAEGWGAVTTRRVAEVAGVGAGLVHYHAGSVAALRRDAVLLRRYRAGLTEQLRTAGLAEPEATAALLTALVDGALLQRSLDPRLDLEPVVTLLSTQLRAVRRDL